MVALKRKLRLEDNLDGKAYHGDDKEWIAAEKAVDAAWRATRGASTGRQPKWQNCHSTVLFLPALLLTHANGLLGWRLETGDPCFSRKPYVGTMRMTKAM